MAKEVEEHDFMMLGTYVDSIDDVRDLFGEECAIAFAERLVLFGVYRVKKLDLNSICNATLESIFPKIEKSKERLERKKKQDVIRSIKSKGEEKQGGDGDDRNE